jgi:3',5'-cyclic AMP phosphodiesterase CpdA
MTVTTHAGAVVNRKLTWLHISDIHFHPDTEWRDNAARDASLEYLRRVYDADDSLRPDLIFCTGDIAFGETGSAPLAEQYEQARSTYSTWRIRTVAPTKSRHRSEPTYCGGARRVSRAACKQLRRARSSPQPDVV